MTGLAVAGAIVPDWPAPPSVRAVATTREGGASGPPWTGFNLGAHVGDDPAAVAANRARLRQVLGLPAEPLWLTQVHGARVVEVGPGSPADPLADGCVTSGPGVACAILTADCLPILLCDRAGTRVGALHAGWRGLAAGIVAAGVTAMRRPAREVLAWLGPGIGPGAYEVGPEVRDAFLARHPGLAVAFTPGRPGHWQLALAAAARLLLQAAGVAAVHDCGLCTHADPARFYSHRRDGTTGRGASLIWITPAGPAGARPA